MKEAEFTREELRARVITAWLDGQTPSQVSDWLGIAKSRVHAVISSTPGLVGERARREAQAEREVKLAAWEWSRGHHGVPFSDGAAELGIGVDRLRYLLGERVAFHTRRPAPVRGCGGRGLEQLTRKAPSLIPPSPPMGPLTAVVHPRRACRD